MFTGRSEKVPENLYKDNDTIFWDYLLHLDTRYSIMTPLTNSMDCVDTQRRTRL